MTERVKRMIGLAPRQTGNKIIINCEKLEKRVALLGMLDVILCRNVIIYFDLETKRRVVRTFHEKLRPGGYLLLGHSESLINLSTDFELKHLRHDMVYRRPAESDPAVLEEIDAALGEPSAAGS